MSLAQGTDQGGAAPGKKALQGQKTESLSGGGGKEGRAPQKLFGKECAHTSSSGDRSPSLTQVMDVPALPLTREAVQRI